MVEVYKIWKFPNNEYGLGITKPKSVRNPREVYKIWKFPNNEYVRNRLREHKGKKYSIE